MKQNFYYVKILFLLGTILSASCVNLELPKEPKKNPNISYSAPKAPFKEFYSPQIDKAWRNSETGATISIFSECSNPTDPTNENIIKGIFASLSDPTLERQEDIKISGEKGIHAVSSGLVENVKSKVDVVVFRKSECTYLLSYISNIENYKSLEPDFKKFVMDFGVP